MKLYFLVILCNRDALFGGISKVGKTWGTKETEETVDLDNSAVSQLQRDKFKRMCIDGL